MILGFNHSTGKTARPATYTTRSILYHSVREYKVRLNSNENSRRTLHFLVRLVYSCASEGQKNELAFMSDQRWSSSCTLSDFERIKVEMAWTLTNSSRITSCTVRFLWMNVVYECRLHNKNQRQTQTDPPPHPKKTNRVPRKWKRVDILNLSEFVYV